MSRVSGLRDRSREKNPRAVTFLLSVAPAVLVAIGFALRLYGYNFDDQLLLHPDELAIDQVVTNLGCCLGTAGAYLQRGPTPWRISLTPIWHHMTLVSLTTALCPCIFWQA